MFVSSLHSLLYSFLVLFLFCGSSLFSDSLCAQTGRNDQVFLDFMDPETFYSFKGLDGKGFLRRSPVNLPQPLFEGKETGLVSLLFTITPSGQISRVRQERNDFMTASKEMTEVSITAVKQWKFNPLPLDVPQSEEEVRVVVQFNYTGSGVLYSADGQFTIEGLEGGRRPVKLIPPDYSSQHQGVVTVMATIGPTGGIAWIDKFYGLIPSQQVVPRLGIITDQAVRKWRFTPIPEGEEQIDQQIKITCRYIRWQD